MSSPPPSVPAEGAEAHRVERLQALIVVAVCLATLCTALAVSLAGKLPA